MGLQRVGHDWATKHTHVVGDIRHKRYEFNPQIGKIPWRREWLPTPVSFPGKFHEQRTLAGYIPWCPRVGHDWATTPHTHTHTHMFYILHYVININNDQEEYSYFWYHEICEAWLYSSCLICREYRLIQGGWIVLILFSFNGGRANKLFIVHWIWWPGSNQMILWTQGRLEVKSLRWIVSVAL